MRSTKNLRIAGLIIIFTAAFGVGFKSGAGFGVKKEKLMYGYPASMTSSPTDQKNILIIHVDQIDKPDAILKGIWLMAYYTNNPRVDLLPIFPSIKPFAQERNNLLQNSFSLTNEGEPGESFWLEMLTLNTWWNAYILLEDNAIKILADHFLVSPVNQDYAFGINPPWTEISQFGIEEQPGYYALLCQGFPQNSGGRELIELWSAIHNHTHTNMTLVQIRQLWVQLDSYQSGLTCNFPSLHDTSP
jgi:hypothetical protein